MWDGLLTTINVSQIDFVTTSGNCQRKYFNPSLDFKTTNALVFQMQKTKIFKEFFRNLKYNIQIIYNAMQFQVQWKKVREISKQQSFTNPCFFQL